MKFHYLKTLFEDTTSQACNNKINNTKIVSKMAKFCKILVSTLLIVLIVSENDAAISSVNKMKSESFHVYSLGLEQNGKVKNILKII